MPKRKTFTNKQLTVISIIIATLALIVAIIFGMNAWQGSPISSVDFLVHTSTIDVIYADNTNTTVTAFNVTFSAWVTNNGTMPLHIVAFDIFPKDAIANNASYSFTDLKYLQPNDSFDYNYTKLFKVDIPAKTATIPEYVGTIVYRDNSGNIKTAVKDLFYLTV